MTIIELYNYIDSKDILLINGELKKSPSMSLIDEDKNCAIVIDEDKLKKSCESDKEIVAHELGHCETGSFYTANTLEIRSRCEYRADKWAIKKLVPKDELRSFFENSGEESLEVWQAAEKFGVSEKLIKKALWIYFDIRI